MKQVLIPFILLLFVNLAVAQAGYNPPRYFQEAPGDEVFAAPDVQAFHKYAFIPENLYVERINLDIPIYRIQSGNISVPISLSYNSGGIKVSDMASNTFSPKLHRLKGIVWDQGSVDFIYGLSNDTSQWFHSNASGGSGNYSYDTSVIIKDLCRIKVMILMSCFGTLAQSPDENYIKTTTYTAPSTGAITPNDTIVNATYFDDLGRAKQNIAVRGGDGKQDHNMIPWKENWTVGTGAVPFFNANGTLSENERESGIDPFGNTSMLWKCVNDPEYGPDGGCTTDYFSIDNTVAYRYTVWVKRTGEDNNGLIHHGTQNVNNLDGIVHPHHFAGGDTGVSGVYDAQGNKVFDGTEFKWDAQSSTSRFRNYFYYSVNANNSQYFYNPMLQKLDGTEASLDDILFEREVPDVVTPMVYNFGRQTRDYMPYATATQNGSIHADPIAAVDAFYNVPTLQSSDFYNAGQLDKIITKDENWQPGDGKLHTTEEFKDKKGRVILKRTYADLSGELQAEHNTYYVYDRFGNLTYVIPPKVITGDGVSPEELSELCYQYRYDYRTRLIEKKLPGKGWEYVVYNTLNRPVFTQDPNLAAANRWLFTKYDRFGRVVYTGIFNSVDSRETLQAAMNGITALYNTKTGSPTVIDGTEVYYDNTAFPTANIEVLTINYYDDYVFDLAGGTTEDAYEITPTVCRLWGSPKAPKQEC